MAKEPIILTDPIVPTPALMRAGMDALPAAILAHGERTSRRFIEFFTLASVIAIPGPPMRARSSDSSIGATHVTWV
jgi:hypothetical protein